MYFTVYIFPENFAPPLTWQYMKRDHIKEKKHFFFFLSLLSPPMASAEEAPGARRGISLYLFTLTFTPLFALPSHHRRGAGVLTSNCTSSLPCQFFLLIVEMYVCVLFSCAAFYCSYSKRFPVI